MKQSIITPFRSGLQNSLNWFLAPRLCLLFLGILSLAFNNTTTAATYYLDAVNGNDSNPGTSDQPWKTVAKAQGIVISGDTVIVRNGSYGSYSEANVGRTDWVTYQAAPGHSPQITYILINTQNAMCNAYLKFDGFTIGPPGRGSVIEIRNSRYTQFLNLNIIGSGASNTSHGFYGWGGSTDIVIDNCTFSGGANTGRFDGFNTGIGADGCDNLIITNNEIRQFHYMGVYVSCKNIIVRNNNIHYCGADAGIAIGEGNGPLLVENNQVYDLRLYQPSLSETPTETTWSVDGKTMTNPNATWEINSPIGSWVNNVEIWINSGTNAKTRDNDVTVATVVSSTEIRFSKSIKLDPNGPTPSNVDYILIDKTHGDLLQVYAYGVTSNLTIRNNQFYDCEGQFWWVNPYNSNELNNRGGHNFLIENNLLWNSYTSGQAEYDHNTGIFNIEGLIFRNNTIIGRLEMNSCGNVKFHNNIIGYIAAGSTVGWIENDYNIINRGFIASPYGASVHDTFFYPNQYSWTNYNAPAFTVIFADYTNGDFRHASASSLGVGHGDPANSPSTDIRGKPRDDHPDAGCYEYIPGIDPINHPPVFNPIGNKSVSAGSVLTFTVKATDADGGTLIYWATDLPQGATFDHVTKTFTWTPTKNQIGVYTVTFKVRDNSLITAETITITVGTLITVPTDANSIQKAINLADTGDTVIVEQGRYRENIHFNGKNIILKSTNPDDPDIVANTIIDGNEAGSVVTFSPGNQIVGFSLSSSSVQLSAFFAVVGDEIAGFTITGGNAMQGGGIYIDTVCPTIEKNIITANNAIEGGGIYCRDDSAIIRLNKITGNNTAFGVGGAICGVNSSATVANNLIVDNAAYYGSGIMWFKGKPTIVNNTIACNSSTLNIFTCGIAIDSGEPSSFIKNNIIAFNNNGTGIYGLSELAPASFTYNNVFANSTGNYGGKLTDQTGRNGNISTDPFFFDTNNKDFHLKSSAGRWDANSQSWLTDTVTSPCIDAGDPNDNFAGELWPHGRRINMGAFGGTPQASMSESDAGSIADLNNDGIVDYVDMAIFTQKWLSNETSLHEDLNHDGIVDFKDFAILSIQ